MTFGAAVGHIHAKFHENPMSRSSAVKKIVPAIAGCGLAGTGFRASSAVSKRLDRFITNLASHWTPVVRKRMTNFFPICSADRFRPFASGCCRPIVCYGSLTVERSNAELRRPYAVRECTIRTKLCRRGSLALARHAQNFMSIGRAISKRQSTHGTRYRLLRASCLSSVRL